MTEGIPTEKAFSCEAFPESFFFFFAQISVTQRVSPSKPPTLISPGSLALDPSFMDALILRSQRLPAPVETV